MTLYDVILDTIRTSNLDCEAWNEGAQAELADMIAQDIEAWRDEIEMGEEKAEAPAK